MTEDIPLMDADDLTILMHRDAHFGGQFPIMIEYYTRGGKGALLDLDRIEQLAKVEAELGDNLASIMLSDAELQMIGEAQGAYQQLRAIYELAEEANPRPRLIADLILAEDEEEEEAIKAVVEQGEAIVPELIQLLRSENFLDPLFPGYGTAHSAAAGALGQIGSKEAIIPLFEALGEEDADIIEALVSLGEPAKAFLLKVVQIKPLSLDTERAAAGLSAFPADEKIASVALSLLKEEEVRKALPLSAYLAICCAGLADKTPLQEIANMPDLPDMTRDELVSLMPRGQ